MAQSADRLLTDRKSCFLCCKVQNCNRYSGGYKKFWDNRFWDQTRALPALYVLEVNNRIGLFLKCNLPEGFEFRQAIQ